MYNHHMKTLEAVKAQIQRMINMYEGTEQGYQISYYHAHDKYEEKLFTEINNFPDSDEKTETLNLLEKLNKIHYDLRVSLSNAK